MAVKPAVPIAITWAMSRPSGNGSSQSALTRARWARPPQWRSPTPQPVSRTCLAGRETRVGRGRDRAGEIDAGHEGELAHDLAGTGDRQRVLVVQG